MELFVLYDNFGVLGVYSTFEKAMQEILVWSTTIEDYSIERTNEIVKTLVNKRKNHPNSKVYFNDIYRIEIHELDFIDEKESDTWYN